MKICHKKPCTKLNAMTAAKQQQSPSNQHQANQFTAEHASPNTPQTQHLQQGKASALTLTKCGQGEDNCSEQNGAFFSASKIAFVGIDGTRGRFLLCGPCGELLLKTLKGWKKLNHEEGYLNDTTGQTLVISKKEFSSEFQVLVFEGRRTEDNDGKKISPDFQNQKKAENFAIDWMTRNPNGTQQPSN